jgi:hypothetical protein
VIKRLQKAIASLPVKHGTDSHALASELVKHIETAFLRYGSKPKGTAKELEKIRALSAALHRALNHASPAAGSVIASNLGGDLTTLRTLRRGALANLADLYRGAKAAPGAKPKLYARAVADAAAATYTVATGREPTRVTNPDTNVPGGAFRAFLITVFEIADVPAVADTYVARLTAGRKARGLIAA